MSLSQDAGQRIRTDVSLSSCVTMKIGGPADFFAEPESAAELKEVLKWNYKIKLEEGMKFSIEKMQYHRLIRGKNNLIIKVTKYT